ncbi:MAG: hypothetical protein JNJ83_01485 [Verrucomicrobiaceae bacterium]|nr:hypothetical protein [Verrucomicrobiaceae bacterium]
MNKPTLLSTLAAAALGLWLSFTTAQAQTFETLFSDNQGRNPYANLIQGSDGTGATHLVHVEVP